MPNDKKEREQIKLSFVVETDYLGKGEPLTIAPREEQPINQTIEQLSHISDIELLRNLGGN